MQLLVRRKENHPAARVLQHKRRLLGRQRRIERDRNRSEQQARHVGHGPLGTVFAEQCNAIAGLDSPGMEGAGSARHAFAKFARRNRHATCRLRGTACMRSRLRSTAAKKMSFSVAMLIASFESLSASVHNSQRQRLRTELYCFASAFSNAYGHTTGY